MYYMHDGGWAGGPGGGWGWGIAMIVGMLALVALASFAVFWLTRDRGGRTFPTATPHPATPTVTRETPIEILERRLANGELSVTEYQERRTVLEREPGSASGED